MDILKRNQVTINASLRNVDAFLNTPDCERWLMKGFESEDVCQAEEHTPEGVHIHKCLQILRIKDGAGLGIIQLPEGTFETRIILSNKERRASPGSEVLQREKETSSASKQSFRDHVWIIRLCYHTVNADSTARLLEQYMADHPY